MQRFSSDRGDGLDNDVLYILIDDDGTGGAGGGGRGGRGFCLRCVARGEGAGGLIVRSTVERGDKRYRYSKVLECTILSIYMILQSPTHPYTHPGVKEGDM